MKYAPIIIPTLNRYNHLTRCIESLKNNKWADETELYISLDYPPSEKYVEGYRRIKEYLDKGIEGFKKVNVFYQKQNLGAVDNFLFLIDLVYKDNDNMIFTEDDNEFSPNFLDYMNKGLKIVREDRSLIAVGGYSYLVDWPNDGQNVEKICSLFSCWGFGMWKDDLLGMKNYIENKMEKELKGGGIKKLRKKQRFLMCATLDSFENINLDMFDKGHMRLMDTTMAIHNILQNRYMIVPKKSLVRNWGNDGSGIHGGEMEDTLCKQEIYQDREFEFSIQNGFEYNPEMDKIMNQYLYRSEFSTWKRLWIYKIRNAIKSVK